MAGHRNRKGTVAVQNFKGVLRLVWSFQGKQHYLYCGLADTPLNRIVAEGRAKIIEGDLVTGNFDPTLAKYRPERQNQISVTELFERFIESKRQQLDPRTLEKYQGLLNRLRDYFGEKAATVIGDTESEKFQRHLATLITPITLKERIGLLKACWEWALKKKILMNNPWAELKIRVPPKQKPKPFTVGEILQILEEIQLHYPHYANFTEFLFGTGCRTGEAIGLRWKHLNDDCSQVWIGESISRGECKPAKTNRSRIIPLTPRLQQMLLARRPDCFTPEDLVFYSPTGVAIDDHNFRNRIWKPALQALNISYRKPYTTRHTLVSHALEKGMSAVSVAELTGHNARTLYQSYAGIVNKIKLPDIFSDP